MIFKTAIEGTEDYNLDRFTKRVSTGIVGIAILILIFYLGLNAIKFSIFVITIEAIRELYNALINKGIKLYLPSLLLVP